MDTDEAPKKKSSYPKYIIIGVITAALLGTGYYLTAPEKKEPVRNDSFIDSLTDTETIDDGTGPVATVNGEEVTRAEYNNSVRELTELATRAGYSTSNPSVVSQIKQQAVATLINTTLLAQTAAVANVTVSEDAVQEVFAEIEKQEGGADVLKLVLEDRELTEAELKADIRKSLVIEAYIDQTVDLDDVTVTDEEAKEYATSAQANSPELAAQSLDELTTEAKQLLLDQKKQQLVSDYIQTLQATAEIEVLI